MNQVATMNIGTFARKCIAENPAMKNGEILKLVKAQFPNAETKEASIAWYRSKMKTNPVQLVRDANTVRAEIERVQLMLEQLQGELAEMEAKDTEDLLEKEEELRAMLKRIEDAKAAKAQEQTQE